MDRKYFFKHEKDIVGWPPENEEPSYTRVLPTTFIPEWLKKRLEFFYPDSQSRSDYITGLLIADIGQIFSDPSAIEEAIQMIELSSILSGKKVTINTTPQTPSKSVVYLKPRPEPVIAVKPIQVKPLPPAPEEIFIEESQEYVGVKDVPFLKLKGDSLTTEEARFLGDSIVASRTLAGLSQRQLAAKIGVGRSSLFRYEQGTVLENKDKYLFILKILSE